MNSYLLMDSLLNEGFPSSIYDDIKINDNFFEDWNHQTSNINHNFDFNIYDELLNEKVLNETEEETAVSEWESCESEDDEEIEQLNQSNLQLNQCISVKREFEEEEEEEDDVKGIASFCMGLEVPKFCDFDEFNADVIQEMIKTETDKVNMDLLTCSSSNNNCKETTAKTLIKSKYGKWACNGRHNPDQGLGPLEYLFTDNIDTCKLEMDYLSSQIMTITRPIQESIVNHDSFEQTLNASSMTGAHNNSVHNNSTHYYQFSPQFSDCVYQQQEFPNRTYRYHNHQTTQNPFQFNGNYSNTNYNHNNKTGYFHHQIHNDKHLNVSGQMNSQWWNAFSNTSTTFSSLNSIPTIYN